MKRLIKTTALACAFLLPQLAQAALVTQWEYEVSSEWTGATFQESGEGTTATSSSVLSWVLMAVAIHLALKTAVRWSLVTARKKAVT